MIFLLWKFVIMENLSLIGKRKKYSSAFKSKVVLEALKERNTLAELASKQEVSQFMICRWKKEFLDNSASIFKNKKKNFKNIDLKINGLKKDSTTKNSSFINEE